MEIKKVFFGRVMASRYASLLEVTVVSCSVQSQWSVVSRSLSWELGVYSGEFGVVSRSRSIQMSVISVKSFATD